MGKQKVVLKNGSIPPGFSETRACSNCKNSFDLELRDEDGQIDYGEYCCSLYKNANGREFAVFPWTVCDKWEAETWAV